MLPGRLYTPEMILKILRKRIWFILVPLSLAAAGTALWTRTLPDLYRSSTAVQVVPQRISESIVRPTIEVSIEERLPAIRQAILSRTRLENIIKEFDLYPEERKTWVMEDVVERMEEDVEIRSSPREDAFEVSYIGTDPVKVMQVAEKLGNLFIEQSLTYRHALTQDTDQFLSTTLAETRQALEEQERRLENYRRTYAGELPNQVDSNLQQMTAANMQAQQAAEVANAAMQRRLLIERQLAELEREPGQPTPESAPTADIGAAREVAAIKATIDGYVARGLKPGHPDLDAATRRLRDAEQKLAAELEAARTSGPRLSPAELARRERIEDLTDQLSEIDKQIADARAREQRFRSAAEAAQARLDAVPTRETELIALTRDYDILVETYRQLQRKQEEARIAANLERRQFGEQFNVIDPARLPERPYSPDRSRMNTTGAAAGLVVGLVLVGLLEWRDRGFRSDEEITSLLGLPVLAVVPVMQSESDRRRRTVRSVLINLACGSLVTACLAIYVYIFVKS
jgi:polysaccharide chain length determinant protein (PEP-CTERM system associated)